MPKMKYIDIHGIQKETASSFIDITDQRYNELTAKRYIGNRLWEWECSCGKRVIIRKNDVVSGKKKSCGHIYRRNIDEYIKVGTQINEWTIKEIIDTRRIRCICSCGKESILYKYDIIDGKSKSCGHNNKGNELNGRKDISYTQIGEWHIGEYLGNGKYRCTCSCGTVKELSGTYLRTNQSKSCGCKSNTFKDLTDKHFGEWHVKRYLGNHKWLCKCSCEKEGIVSSYDLTHGKSTNCGHLRLINNLKGRKFDNLRVIEYIGDNLWKCECKCGNITTALTVNLLNGNKKSCGCLAVEKRENVIENIKKSIDDFYNTFGQLPFIEDIAQYCEMSDTTIRKYIKESSLQDKINKTFGSKYEMDIYCFIKQFIPENKIKIHDRNVISPQEIDIYIPSLKLGIEFNGDYWHSEVNIQGKNYHQNKVLDCARKGIRLISIFEYEWKNKETREKIFKLLKQAIDIENNKRVYGRNTYVKQLIGQEALVETFLDNYHMQGYSYGNITLGCFLKETDELIGIMSIGKPRFNNKYQYEIIRLCWKNDITVIGGTSKLFKYFINKYKVNSVITYSDISKFTGNIYIQLGFKPIKPDTFTEPGYVWFNHHINDIKSRYQTQKHILIQQGFGQSNQTESEIMNSLGYVKIYNCGNIKLEYIKNYD